MLLSLSSTRYIKLLDGDDILAPDSLKYMKSQMQKNIDFCMVVGIGVQILTNIIL